MTLAAPHREYASVQSFIKNIAPAPNQDLLYSLTHSCLRIKLVGHTIFDSASKMSSPRTYLIAPKLQYLPYGPISLGNVIADPLSPHRPITKLAENKRPQVAESTEPGRFIGRTTAIDGRLSFKVQFLQSIGVNTGVEVGKTVRAKYTVDNLRTQYFQGEPALEDVRELCMEDLVKYIIGSGVRSRPVYMVIGIKIAERLKAIREVQNRQGTSLGGSAPVTAEVSLGAEAGISKERSEADSGTFTNDVVLAYELLQIAQKGWFDTSIGLKEYLPKAGFLRDDEGMEDYNREGAIELETEPTTSTYLAQANSDMDHQSDSQ